MPSKWNFFKIDSWNCELYFVILQEWFLDFVKKISSTSMKKNSEDISCIAMLLISLDPDNISDLLPDLVCFCSVFS